jgi:L-seryl-tRNA(Ser) seleniumtransferase
MSSWALGLAHAERSADEIERALRRCDPPIIGRIEDDRLLLDLRTVPRAADDALADSLRDVILSKSEPT